MGAILLFCSMDFATIHGIKFAIVKKEHKTIANNLQVTGC